MSWFMLFKTGKHLPVSFSQRLATISTADECAYTILGFINDHAPQAQELVFPSLFLFTKLLLLLSLLYFKFSTFPSTFFKFSSLFMDLLSEVEEVMVGAAAVNQSPQERPKGPSTDSTSTPPYSYASPSPSSSPVVSTLSSPSGVPSIMVPPDIPIKVEYLPDPIPVPSPLFHFPGYSTSTSTPSSSSISNFYTPHVTSSPALANPSGQEVSHFVPLFRPTPITWSLFIPSQSLANPFPSSPFSFDMFPPLSSSITHDQNLPSCSFVTPQIIPLFTSTSPASSSILSARKPRGRQPVRGKSSRGNSSRGESPRG